MEGFAVGFGFYFIASGLVRISWAICRGWVAFTDGVVDGVYARLIDHWEAKHEPRLERVAFDCNGERIVTTVEDCVMVITVSDSDGNPAGRYFRTRECVPAGDGLATVFRKIGEETAND